MREQHLRRTGRTREASHGCPVEVQVGNGHRAGAECDLAEQHVAGADQRLQVPCAAAIARIDEGRAVGPVREGDAGRVAFGRMGHAATLDEERPDPVEALRADLDLERSRREVGLARHPVESLRQPRRCDHAHAPRRIELVAQVMAKRHEVNEVVGVEVADDYCGQLRWLEAACEPRERALAHVEADCRPIVEHDIA